MDKFCIGLLFSTDRQRIILIRDKGLNEINKTSLNAIKCQKFDNESDVRSMICGFHNKTNILFSEWNKFCEIKKENDYITNCYRGYTNLDSHLSSIAQNKAVHIYKIDKLIDEQLASNLKWLIFLALDNDINDSTHHISTINY